MLPTKIQKKIDKLSRLRNKAHSLEGEEAMIEIECISCKKDLGTFSYSIGELTDAEQACNLFHLLELHHCQACKDKMEDDWYEDCMDYEEDDW